MYLYDKQEDVEYLYSRLDTRWNSESIIKKNMHRCKINKLLKFLEPGNTLLDVCRGGSVDGILGVMAAQKGLQVTICSVKQEYLDVIKRFATENNIEVYKYIVCEPEDLKFSDESFDYVSCIHVLEHVNDLKKSISEIYRVSKGRVLLALPTCLNACVFARIGGANYYDFNYKSIPCMLAGMGKVIKAWVLGKDGVYENNEEKGEIIRHYQRFPGKVKELCEENGFIVEKYGADGFCFPWLKVCVYLQRVVDKCAYIPVMRNWGFGTHYFLKKRENKRYT